MITLITGTPGAGKTLYAISKLILPLVGSTVNRTLDDGSIEVMPRTVYTNINGLLLDHELIGPGGEWEQDKTKEWCFKPILEGQGLRDWHTWAKPGSVVVYDEFQKVWPPRANGAPVPPDLQALDTHRHMGVDIVLITQSPNNHDRHVQGLVGRHLHVRRFGNMGLTVVYEWDHCSRQLLYSKAISKSPWKFDKKVFRLYKSAEVHTKSPRRLPALFFFIAMGIGASAYLIPNTYNRIKERGSSEISGLSKNNVPHNEIILGSKNNQFNNAIKGPLSNNDSDIKSVEYDYSQFVPRLSAVPNSAPAYDELRKVVNMPRVAGALCSSSRCVCVTEQGTDTGMGTDECRSWLQHRPYDAYTVQPQPALAAASPLVLQALSVASAPAVGPSLASPLAYIDPPYQLKF